MTVKEARKILGKDALGMADSEIEQTLETLQLLAKDALSVSKEKLLMKKRRYKNDGISIRHLPR